MTVRAFSVSSRLVLAATTVLALSAATARDDVGQKSSQDLATIAQDAYIYGYPLMLMAETERRLTNVATAGDLAAPVNELARMTRIPDASFRAVVRPNVDTLYTSAFLDLSREPMILHVPNTGGRYYVVEMLDAYTNVFASPGKRTTGTEAHDFAIVGPRWTGTLPPGVEKIQAPTNMVWLIGRTQLDGPQDLPACVRLNQQFTLTPLGSFGQRYTPPPGKVDPHLDMQVPPPQVVATMDPTTYFETLARLMDQNPPPARDREALARFRRIGLAPGRFAPSPEAEQAITQAPRPALGRIVSHARELGREVNGWRLDASLGDYGTRYDDRASVALTGLGANIGADAVYPTAFHDRDGALLTGTKRYVLHFAPGQEPAVNAFWSITMYDAHSYFVANPLNRYALGSRDALHRNPDGSVDIYIQASEPPGDLVSNWLPAPEGAFSVTMRLYWPKQDVLNGAWTPPPITAKRE